MGTFYEHIAGINAVLHRFNSETAYGHKVIGNNLWVIESSTGRLRENGHRCQIATGTIRPKLRRQCGRQHLTPTGFNPSSTAKELNNSTSCFFSWTRSDNVTILPKMLMPHSTTAFREPSTISHTLTPASSNTSFVAELNTDASPTLWFRLCRVRGTVIYLDMYRRNHRCS